MVSFLGNKYPSRIRLVNLVNLDSTSHIPTCRAAVHIDARLPRLLDLCARCRLLCLLSMIAKDISHQVHAHKRQIVCERTYLSKSLA